MKLIALLLAFMFTSFSFCAAQELQTDSTIAKKLTGTWTGKQKGFLGTLVYNADGTCTSHLEPVDFFVQLVANPYDFSGTWKIKNGLLYSTVAKSSTQAIKPGTVYKNEILQLNDTVFCTRNDRGWISEFQRKR